MTTMHPTQIQKFQVGSNSSLFGDILPCLCSRQNDLMMGKGKRSKKKTRQFPSQLKIDCLPIKQRRRRTCKPLTRLQLTPILGSKLNLTLHIYVKSQVGRIINQSNFAQHSQLKTRYPSKQTHIQNATPTGNSSSKPLPGIINNSRNLQVH